MKAWQHHHAVVIRVDVLVLAAVRVEASLHAYRQPGDLLLWTITGLLGFGRLEIWALSSYNSGIRMIITIILL